MSAIRAVKWAAVDAGASRAVALLTAILVARVLGPENMGLVALVFLVMEAGRVLTEFGMSQAIIHHRALTKRQLATLYSCNWILGIAAFLIIELASPWLAAVFGEPQLALLLQVAAVGFLMAPIAQQVNAILQKGMDFRTLAIPSVMASCLGLAVAVGGVYAGFGVWAVVVSSLSASMFLQLAWLYVGIRRGLWSGFDLAFRATQSLLIFSAYRTGATVLNMVNSRIDHVIVGGALGTSALGIYAMASRWTVEPMQQLNGIATRVAFPAIARIQSDISHVRSAYLRLVNRIATVNAALFFGLAAVADPLVLLVLGPDWGGMVLVLQIMCAYVVVRSLGNVNGALVMGLGKVNWAFYWNLGLVLVIPPVLLAASQLGGIAIIASSLLALQLVLAGIAYLYWVRRLLGACLGEYVMAFLVPWGCGAGMGIFVYFLLGQLSHATPTVQLLITIPAGALVFVALNAAFNGVALRELISLVSVKGDKDAETRATP